jgi:hypothetical protein
MRRANPAARLSFAGQLRKIGRHRRWLVRQRHRIKIVDELTANGVGFEHYDQSPIATDAKGIAVIRSTKGAWFKDPDGNTSVLSRCNGEIDGRLISAAAFGFASNSRSRLTYSAISDRRRA